MTPEWYLDAACRGMPVDLFLGADGETQAERRRRERQAVQICGTCRTRVQCLRLALERPEVYGVWGGTVESQRQVMRQKGQPAA